MVIKQLMGIFTIIVGKTEDNAWALSLVVKKI